jgi:hypothetical protein
MLVVLRLLMLLLPPLARLVLMWRVRALLKLVRFPRLMLLLLPQRTR